MINERIIIMKIVNEKDGDKLILNISGRLDTTTAPQLENELNLLIDDISDLTMDLTELEYISSAGLRILLQSQQAMNKKKGKMTIKGARETILDIFNVTGFSDILNIE